MLCSSQREKGFIIYKVWLLGLKSSMKAVSTKSVPVLPWPNNKSKHTKSPLKWQYCTCSKWQPRMISSFWKAQVWTMKAQKIKIITTGHLFSIKTCLKSQKKKKQNHLQATFFPHTLSYSDNQQAQFGASLAPFYSCNIRHWGNRDLNPWLLCDKDPTFHRVTSQRPGCGWHTFISTQTETLERRWRL